MANKYLFCFRPLYHSCADPGNFARGGPTFFFFFFVRGKRIQIALKAGHHHLNRVSLAGRCWTYIECWLGSFVIFQGIRTSIAKKPYIFVIFSEGYEPPVPPLWIRTCHLQVHYSCNIFSLKFQ